MIALTDRWYQPSDSQGEEKAMFSLDIPADGNIGKDIKLEKEKWHTITFDWNFGEGSKCAVQIDGKMLIKKLPLNEPCENGISYVRFRSLAIWPDNEGFLIESVRAKVK